MDKTVTVSVERRFMHPKYKKYIRKTTKYAAHDESNAVKEGDLVQIIECAPISKRKTWTVVKPEGQNPEGQKSEVKEEKKAPAKKSAVKKAAKKTPSTDAKAKAGKTNNKEKK